MVWLVMNQISTDRQWKWCKLQSDGIFVGVSLDRILLLTWLLGNAINLFLLIVVLSLKYLCHKIAPSLPSYFL